VAKQVKVDSKKAKPAKQQDGRLTTRSPMTNLVFAGILGLIYIVVFNQNGAQALLYAIGAFLFFNTVDYCILYYRMNKNSKETK
jgi:hypothetical protein